MMKIQENSHLLIMDTKPDMRSPSIYWVIGTVFIEGSRCMLTEERGLYHG